jgi:hypothetical protein
MGAPKTICTYMCKYKVYCAMENSIHDCELGRSYPGHLFQRFLLLFFQILDFYDCFRRSEFFFFWDAAKKS